MGNKFKPATAEGYSTDVTEMCERALVTLLTAFGTLKSSLRLVGGLVPRYLTPALPHGVPPHPGTSDVDIALNLVVIGRGEQYASLRGQLKAKGFSRVTKEDGTPSSWQWQIDVGHGRNIVVEFLCAAEEGSPQGLQPLSAESISAMAMPHLGIVHDWYNASPIEAELLPNGGFHTVTIHYPDVPAFIILKALALDNRAENKDAADLIHVLRYAGEIEDIADQFVRREQSNQHPGAIKAGLDALRNCFCDGEKSSGYQKSGSVGYATFHLGHPDDDDDIHARVRKQRDASTLVQDLLNAIERKKAAAIKSESAFKQNDEHP